MHSAEISREFHGSSDQRYSRAGQFSVRFALSIVWFSLISIFDVSEKKKINREEPMETF